MGCARLKKESKRRPQEDCCNWWPSHLDTLPHYEIWIFHHQPLLLSGAVLEIKPSEFLDFCTRIAHTLMIVSHP